jgi:CRP-like cAMP-binding protein
MLTALPPIFAGMSPEISAEAQAFLSYARFEVGDTIMLEGEDDQTLAFVLSGTIELSASGTVLGHAIAREVVGEVELFARCPRMATATASTAVELLVLDPAGFVELLDVGNPVTYALERQVIRRLGERIRELNERVASLSVGEKVEGTSKTTGGGLIARLFSPLSRPSAPRADADPTETLQRSEVYNWAPAEVVGDIAKAFEPVSFYDQAIICKQGDTADKMFVLASGEVDVVLDLETGRREKIAHLVPGHAFGDSSIAMGTPRSASCIARGPVVAVALDRQKFLELHSLDNGIGSVFRQGIIRNLILQLMATTDKLLALHAAREMSGELTDEGGRRIWRD